LLAITKSFFEKTGFRRINFGRVGRNFIDIFPQTPKENWKKTRLTGYTDLPSRKIPVV
jgi:hypothetical protein